MTERRKNRVSNAISKVTLLILCIKGPNDSSNKYFDIPFV